MTRHLLLWLLPVVAGAAVPRAVEAAPTPVPPAVLGHVQHRLSLILQDAAHRNRVAAATLEPDSSGLRTIVRVTVRGNYAAQLRADMAKNVRQYVAIHRGDCKTNRTMTGRTASFALQPFANGVSTTYVNVPLSTLSGHGNVITTQTSDGTVVNCAAI